MRNDPRIGWLPRSDARAFTLIELLVVIAIISILAALLLPALSSARDYGKSASCMSNQKQIMLANYSYASDNCDYFVPANQGTSATGWDRYWFYSLASGSTYINKSVLRCPSDPLPTPFGCTSECATISPISYGYSRALGDNYARKNWGGWPNTPDTQYSRWFRPLRGGDFQGQGGFGSKPATAIVLFDFVNVKWGGTSWTTYNLKVDNSALGTLRVSARHSGGNDSAYGNSNNVFIPLAGGGNFTFVDGHCESIRAPYRGSGNVGNCPEGCEFAGNFW